MDTDIFKRKNDHIKKILDLKDKFKPNTWLDSVILIHNALPNANFDEIQCNTMFLGKKIGYPIMIDAITGGTGLAEKINNYLARLANQYNIPLCVGSQRILLEYPNNEILQSFQCIRKFAPDILLFGNIGISEILKMEDITQIKEILSIIDADGLVIHLNSLQEMIQPSGNKNFKNSISQLKLLKNSIKYPIIIKEVGSGISAEVIHQLFKINYTNFNLAGLGGTNFALVESLRAEEKNVSIQANTGKIFSNWGIPTAASIIETRHVLEQKGTLIASGGIRSGLDIAKSLCLGADICAMAYPFLAASLKGYDYLNDFMKQIIFELKTTMLLTSIKHISDFPNVPKVILPPLLHWINQRNKNQ